MSTMTKDVTGQMPSTIAILIILSIIGSIGNILVLIIYSQKRDRSTANQFIKYLAISDTIVCLLIIPYTIYIEYKDWKLSIDAICKCYYFLNNSSIPFGALLLTLIAVDRYLCICHPFLSLMTIRRSKICVLSFFTLSVFIGIMSAFQVKVVPVSINITAVNYSVNKAPENQTECVDLSIEQDQTRFEEIFFKIVQRSQLISYSICIIVVICLYILIYRSVLAAATKRAKLKGMNRSSSKCVCCVRLRKKTETLQYGNSLNDSDDATMHCQPMTNCSVRAGPSINEHVIKRKFKETILLQNFKTAIMLFVVAMTYIVSFLPACLMVNGVLKLYLPVFYLYYVNNAANPIIYGFMNKNFRDDVKSFFNNYFAK